MIIRSSHHQEKYEKYVEAADTIINCSFYINGFYAIFLVLTSLKKYKIPLVTLLVNTNFFTYDIFFATILINFVLSFIFLMFINLYYQLKYKNILHQREVYFITFHHLISLFLFSLIIVFLYLAFISGFFYDILVKIFY